MKCLAAPDIFLCFNVSVSTFVSFFFVFPLLAVDFVSSVYEHATSLFLIWFLNIR